MRARGAFLTGLLALGLLLPGVARADAQRWPAAVVIVVERRVDSLTTAFGAQLRALRQVTVRELTEGRDPLSAGDHVFMFADGLTREAHQNLLREISPSSPEKAQVFLAHHLRLPETFADAVSRQRAPDGVEFVHAIYDGDPEHLSCLLARQLTVPLTLHGTEGSDCPEEGSQPDQTATRAVSRPDLTYAIQLDHALAALPPGAPLRSLRWILIRSSGRRYDRTDVYDRIEQDYPPATRRAFATYYGDATRMYVRDEAQSALPGNDAGATGAMHVSAITWRPALEVGRRFDAAAGLPMTIGAAPLPRSGALSIGVSLDGEWMPPLETLVVRLKRTLPDGGWVRAAQVRITETDVRGTAVRTTSHDLLPAGGDTDTLASDPHAEAELAARLQALKALRARVDARLELATDVLLDARAEDPDPEVAARVAEYGWRPVPIPRSSRVAITIRGRTVGQLGHSERLGLAALSACAVLVLAWVWCVVWRAEPMTLAVKPAGRLSEDEAETLQCIVPDTSDEAPAGIDIRLGSASRLRRLGRTRTRATITWECLASPQLPLRGPESAPVMLTAGDVTIPEGRDSSRTVGGRARLGSAGAPRSSGIRLDVHAATEALDLGRVPRTERFRCALILHLSVEPRRRLFPCRAVTGRFNVLLDLQVLEQQPTPTLDVEVDETWRRLGFDLPPGKPPEGFATAIITNGVTGGAIARPIAIRSSIMLEAAPPGVGVVLRPVDDSDPTDHSDREAQTVLYSGHRRTFRLDLVPPAVWTDGAVRPLIVRGSAHVEWTSAAGEQGTLEHPFEVVWIAVAAAPLGLDFGTSGTRIAVPKSRRSPQIAEIAFHMDLVQPGDAERPDEFPATVTMNEQGNVMRAGLGEKGIDTDPHHRIVPSPKSALLAALADPRPDADSLAAAKRDCAGFLRAVARAAVPEIERHSTAIQLVAGVPWSFGQETLRWFQATLTDAFPNVTSVTILREAEAVAYFHLLAPRTLWGDTAYPLPRGREYRCLVVDQGAGTTDFALVGVRTGGPSNAIQGVRTVAMEQSLFAGDRYDEQMLDALFEESYEIRFRLSEDRHLREEVRRFKRDALDGTLQRRTGGAYGQLGPHRKTTVGEFRKRMDVFFQAAFDEPVARLVASLEAAGEPRYVDLVLVAGRGMLAFGCTEHLRAVTRAQFESAPGAAGGIAVERVALAELPWAVAKGAVQFARDGDVVEGASDRQTTRDVVLFASAGPGTRPDWRILLPKGRLPKRPIEQRLAFNFDVHQAWLVAMRDHVDDEEARVKLFATLAREGEAQEHGRVLASVRPPHGARYLRVRIDSDERGTLATTDFASAEGP